MVHYRQLTECVKSWIAGYFLSNHKKYAVEGFKASSFYDATVVCIGQEKDSESLTIWQASDDNLFKRFSQQGPHSIGLWYTSMLARAGLTLDDTSWIEYMRRNGDPERLFMDVISDFIITTGCGYDPTTQLRQEVNKGYFDWRSDLTSRQDLCDIVAATQQVYVYVIHNILCWTRMYMPSSNLVLVGSYDIDRLAHEDLQNFYQKVEHYNSLKSLTKTTKVL
jgi:predicted NodU family carbamoyl transferase